MEDKKAHSFGSWLSASRKHYLEFLRNLTPQILLASLAWMLALKLNFKVIDFGNAVPTAGFFIYLTAFGWAFWANATLFLENLFPEFIEWRKTKEGALTSAGVRGWRFLSVFLRDVLKHRPIEGVLSIAM